MLSLVMTSGPQVPVVFSKEGQIQSKEVNCHHRVIANSPERDATFSWRHGRMSDTTPWTVHLVNTVNAKACFKRSSVYAVWQVLH